MGLGKTKLYKELIKAALTYHEKQPWNGLLNGHGFALRLPGEEYPWFATVMGGGGEEYGLSITRGPDAARQQASMLFVNPEEIDRDELDLLGFTVNPLCEVPPEMRTPLEKAKFHARRETLVPFFIVNEAYRNMRAIHPAEAESLLYILNAILKTIESGDFKPGMFSPNCDILTLSISGDQLEPDVKVSFEQYEIPVSEESEFAEPDDPESVPDADDLDGWKKVDLRVTRRIAQAVGDVINTTTMTRYFGSASNARKMLEAYRGEGAEACYIDWLGCEYRPSPSAATVAESLLDTALPKADRLLLQSRAASVPTFCRMAGTQGPHTVLFEDLFTGESFEAHDRMLAESLRRGKVTDVILSLRHYAVGNFRFLCMTGPNFTSPRIPDALAFLEEQGLSPSDKGFRKKPHLLGRLWRLYDEYMHTPSPAMCNTDGDPIEWHCGSYAIDDMNAFRTALESRRDIESEEDNSHEFTWFREKKKTRSSLGDRMMLGRIQLIGGEAVTDVNSVKRHEQMKKWMVKLPGVRFLNVQRRDIREMMEEGPLDDELNPSEPMEITPEIAAALNQHMRDYYMGWLDESIPALDGKTPRQACKTKAGKIKVAAMIRSMGPPMMDGAAHGVDVPRAEMLKELGLQ